MFRHYHVHPQVVRNQYFAGVTQVFQMQLLVIQFKSKMFHICFVHVLSIVVAV